MDKGYEKEGFDTIKIKTSVAQRFRRYCRGLSRSQSMALLEMMAFFEHNGVSPQDDLGETIASLKGQILKRSNAIIAIIKNIEKTYHRPTTAMLQSLFEETVHMEQEENAALDFGTPSLISEEKELDYYRSAYNNALEAYGDLKRDTKRLLDRVKLVRNNFGVVHFRLHISKEDLERLKQKYD